MEATMLIQMTPEKLGEMIEEAVKRAFAKRKDEEAKKVKVTVKPEDQLYTLDEVTERLNMTAGSIRRKILSGEIEGVKVGQKWMVKMSAIEEYLRDCKERMPMTTREIESLAATHCALNQASYVRIK